MATLGIQSIILLRHIAALVLNRLNNVTARINFLLFCFYQRSLDILKIDTEGSLWETLANISYPGVIDDVKLLIFEAHTQIPRPLIYFRSKDDYIEHLTSLRRLYDLGFRIYYIQRWPMCTIKDDNGEIRTGCHDIHFLQKKFLYEQS